jgi:uncharacterized protein YjbJ (UPF0337 family)
MEAVFTSRRTHPSYKKSSRALLMSKEPLATLVKQAFCLQALGSLPAQTQPIKGRTMNKDQVKGRVEQASGKVKEVTGKVVGNERLKTEGQAEQIKGKVQAGFGDAKQNVKDKAHKAVDKL